VFERGGSFPIDTVVQPWWDLKGQRLRKADGLGATVAVAAVVAPPSSSARLELWLYAATTAAGTLALLLWAWPRVQAARAARRARWEASEPKAFRDLQDACRDGDARSVYRTFTVWRQRSDRATALSSFAEEIESTVFAAAPWSQAQAQSFSERLALARRPTDRKADMIVLPPLNPVT